MIWSRQPYDTEASWEAFQAYRDQKPPRRLIRAGKWATADLSTWYREHNWHDRCVAYDVHMDEILLREREAILQNDAKQNAAEHRAILADARNLAANEVQKLLKASNESGAPGLRPAELIKMIDAVVKLDRLVRDQPTENTKSDIDLSGLPIEDVLKLQEIRKKLDGA